MKYDIFTKPTEKYYYFFRISVDMFWDGIHKLSAGYFCLQMGCGSARGKGDRTSTMEIYQASPN